MLKETKPISRKSAAGIGITHELYEPRLADELFPHNGEVRSWREWLEQEALRLNSHQRNVSIFTDMGRLGLAVNCLTANANGCELKGKFGVH
jgi:hypothetical protein